MLASAGRTPKDLLRELGAASMLLIEVVRLRIELAAALRDVESSRARLLHHHEYQDARCYLY